MTWAMSGRSSIMNGDETLPVMRYPQEVGPGLTYVDGKTAVNPKSLVMYHVVCNVQPLTGDDLVQLPEGDRNDDQFWLYTNQDQLAVKVGDLIAREDKTYECQSSEQWGSYTRARCMHIDTQAEPDAEGDGTDDGSDQPDWPS